jgi:hypothetical protein
MVRHDVGNKGTDESKLNDERVEVGHQIIQLGVVNLVSVFHALGC